MNPATRELVLILFLMGVLLVFGLGAVFIFLRVWRRERGPGRDQGAPPGPHCAED